MPINDNLLAVEIRRAMSRIQNYQYAPYVAMEDQMPRQICPECGLPRMNGQTYTCNECWDNMTSRRRDDYQAGRVALPKDTASPGGMQNTDFRRIGDVIRRVRNIAKYGSEREILVSLINELAIMFSHNYPMSCYDQDAFISSCGGSIDDTPMDEERERQRGNLPPPGDMPPSRLRIRTRPHPHPHPIAHDEGLWDVVAPTPAVPLPAPEAMVMTAELAHELMHRAPRRR